jgi:hypothetical protein
MHHINCRAKNPFSSEVAEEVALKMAKQPIVINTRINPSVM